MELMIDSCEFFITRVGLVKFSISQHKSWPQKSPAKNSRSIVSDPAKVPHFMGCTYSHFPFAFMLRREDIGDDDDDDDNDDDSSCVFSSSKTWRLPVPRACAPKTQNRALDGIHFTSWMVSSKDIELCTDIWTVVAVDDDDSSRRYMFTKSVSKSKNFAISFILWFYFIFLLRS